MQSLMLKSNAKVNIGLHIVGKRSDGYHLMETVYYPVFRMFDDIEIHQLPSDDFELKMTGMDEEVAVEQNLVFKAWSRLKSRVLDGPTGIRVVLRKRIPAGAGLGGGSSNAATVLKGLNQLWGLRLSDLELAEMGEGLGADVPFFVYNRPLYATGIGTVFHPIELDFENQGFELRVQTVPVFSSTPLAFKSLDWTQIHQSAPLEELIAKPLQTWKTSVRNDLELSVFPRLPEVAAVKDSLYKAGAVYASMSGSGSACFGIFKQE